MGRKPRSRRTLRSLRGGSSSQHLVHAASGYTVTVVPSLDGSVICMTEAARESANAAQVGDDFAWCSHTQGVRVPSTEVKLDCVRVLCENADMDYGNTTGARFRAIVARSEMSYRDLAKLAGFKSASGIQRYTDLANDKPMSVEVAKRFSAALEGKGNPKITSDEIMSLTGYATETNGVTFRMEGASLERLPRDLPIVGTALGAPTIIDGEAIEQVELNLSEVITYVPRPAALNNRPEAYGVYIQGSSMFPRYSEGETVFVDPKRPPMIGDDVVVFLARPDDHDGDRVSCVMIKRYRRRTTDFVELEQFNPPLVFRLPAGKVKSIQRVIPFSEIFS